MHVVEEMCHDILLGDDAITLLGVELSCRINIVIIDGKSYMAERGDNRDGRLAAVEVALDHQQKYPLLFGKPGTLAEAKTLALTFIRVMWCHLKPGHTIHLYGSG